MNGILIKFCFLHSGGNADGSFFSTMESSPIP